MGFTATRVPTVPPIDPFSGELIVGGGVAAAPTTGTELLDLIRRWTQSQPDLSGKRVTVEVTPTRIIVKSASPDFTSKTDTSVVAQFVGFKRGSGDTPSVLTDVHGGGSNINHIEGRWCVAGSYNASTAAATSADGVLWGMTDLHTQFSSLGLISAGAGFFGLAQSVGPIANKFVTTTDGVVFSEYTRPYVPSIGVGILTVGYAAGFYFYSDGVNLFRSADVLAWDQVLLQYDAEGNEKKEIVGFQDLGAGRIIAYGRHSTLTDTSRRAAVYISTDSGATWTMQLMPGTWTGQITSMAEGAGKLVTHSWSGVGYYSTNDGASWTQITHPDCNVVWCGSFFFGVKTSYGIYSCFTSETGVNDWVDVGLPTWIARPSGYVGTDGTVACISSYETSTQLAFLGADRVWATTPDGESITVSPGDIATINDGGPITFFQSNGLDPAYLEASIEAVGLDWPPTVPTAYTTATYLRGPILDLYDGNLAYFTAAFNGQYFNFRTNAWQDTFTEECKRLADYTPGTFLVELAYIYAGGNAITGNIVGPQTFFITGYDGSGKVVAVEIVSVAAETPSYLELRSNGQYLNFVTGSLQVGSNAETWLGFTTAYETWGNAGARWELHIGDMPLYGAGFETYTPPTDLTPVTGGGQDYVATSGGGYISVPYNPFRLLAVGGFSQYVAQPERKSFTGGFSQPTAPPLPFANSGGFTEATSSVPISTFAAANTQHLGIPFESRG